MGDLIERCILETKAGCKLLFSRSIHNHDMSAQVHDGEQILAQMCFVYSLGKRGRNYMVETFRPEEAGTRLLLTQTYHKTRQSARDKMERLAIRQWKERNEGRF